MSPGQVPTHLAGWPCRSAFPDVWHYFTGGPWTGPAEPLGRVIMAHGAVRSIMACFDSVDSVGVLSDSHMTGQFRDGGGGPGSHAQGWVVISLHSHLSLKLMSSQGVKCLKMTVLEYVFWKLEEVMAPMCQALGVPFNPPTAKERRIPEPHFTDEKTKVEAAFTCWSQWCS